MSPALKTFLLGCLFLLIIAGKAWAHPHVWVIYDVKAISGPEGITKFTFNWKFDNLFTSMVLDEMGVKSITPKDSKQIEEKAFSNLAKYNYYLAFKLDGAEFKPTKAENFSVEQDGQSMVYHFTVTLPKPAKKAELVIFDNEFYVDLGPPTKEDPSNETGSFMKEEKYVVVPFIKTEAEGSGSPPTCSHREGHQKHPLWGKITFFTVECTAAP